MKSFKIKILNHIEELQLELVKTENFLHSIPSDVEVYLNRQTTSITLVGDNDLSFQDVKNILAEIERF